jgi:HEPN domain-containing protein
MSVGRLVGQLLETVADDREVHYYSGMPLPTAPKARPYYRAALQRMDDARFLRKRGREQAAVYLAGYGVECALKALLLNSLPRRKQDQVNNEFRKQGQGHNFDWLIHEYRRAGGAPFTTEIQRNFVTVSTWGTDLRYETGSIKRKEAEAFLSAAEAIVKWAKGRM